jgi:dephospho-CoA kinase
VARLFGTLGAVVVDADAIAREVVEPGGPAYDAVVERFGPAIVLPDGQIDRPALAAVVFNDDAARTDLNTITWPVIGAEVIKRAAAAPEGSVVVLDVPLIAEGQKVGTGRTYDAVIVVEAPKAERLARLEARGMARDDAERRMAIQATDEERRAVADFIVDNSGDLAALEPQVAAIWGEVERLAAAKAAEPAG